MDEETKAALDSIIGHKASRRRASGMESSYTERAKAHKEALYAAAPPSAPPEVHTVYNSVYNAPTAASIVEPAVLSINTSKACVILRAAYTLDVLKDLSALYHQKNIFWDTTNQVFEISPNILAKVKDVLKKHYPGVNVLGLQKQVQATKFDKLMACLDNEDKKRIYSMLARKYHPDMVGGNKDTMTLINLVFKGGD